MAMTADVVIIGGGATGASTAYHLAKRGVKNVLLVEKQFLASGPTGRSSACVRQHYSTPETCRLVLKALRFFERFEEHTGGRTAGFVRTGYLLGVDDRLRKAMESSVQLQQSQGIDSRLITPAEARAIEPRLAIDDLTGACYEPEAGYADPAQTTAGFAAAAREMGVKIMEETSVTGIRVAGDRVSAVETSRGPIETRTVLNAAGTWAQHLGRAVGVEVPITVCRHKIALVEWPADAQGPHPMVYDFVTNIYTRPETGNMILVGPLDSEELEDRARLGLEIARDIGAALVGQRGLARQVDGPAALADHRGREGARLLHIGLVEVFGGAGMPGSNKDGRDRKGDLSHLGLSGYSG